MRSQSEWFFLLSLLLCIVYVSCWWWTQRALRELPSDPLLWPQEYRNGEESISHVGIFTGRLILVDERESSHFSPSFPIQ